MTKACLVIVDGLRYDTALSDCGYLQAAVEAGQARLWQMQSELPTISAPLYAFSEKLTGKDGMVLDQKSIAPTILKLLGIAAPATMAADPLC